MIAAIIQARMGSTRLPGKVLEDLSGKPMLGHIIDRVKRCGLVDKVIVATSDKNDDDPIADLCREYDIDIFRGSENDVLARYYGAATQFGASVVVRITGDCPLIDPAVVDEVVRKFKDRPDCHYASNTMQNTFPDGLDTEVFSMQSLTDAWKHAELPLEREHVTPYIKRNYKNNFSVTYTPANGENRCSTYENLRWTVDESEDLKFARSVYDKLYRQNSDFGMADVLALLEKEPELKEINYDIGRNEGLYLSILKEPSLPAKKLCLEKSHELQEKIKEIIPSASQTFSKGPNQFVQPLSPVFLERGSKAHVWDVDGNEYIDLILGLGPVILGYDYPAVIEAVTKQVRKGASYSLPHPLEVEVAEMLIDLIPCAEMVRFGKNGSDATSGAIRAARAYTGRETVACCGYHGWQDWYIGTTSRNLGIPQSTQELTVPFEYNNLASLQEIFDRRPKQVAAVILEPFSVIEPENDFLSKIKEMTHQNGAILIFDEVITGFRLAGGGAQEYFGVTPDLACFGKALANGYPLSAVVGRKEIMRVFDDIFFSFTYGGEAVSLAAAKATLKEFMDKDVIRTLWGSGRELQEGVNVLIKQYDLEREVRCVGLPPRTIMQLDGGENENPLLLKSLLQQEMISRGVLWGGYHNVCFDLNEADILDVLRAYRAALEIYKDALNSGSPSTFLKGRAVEPVFRKI